MVNLSAQDGVNIVVGSLMRTMVVSIAALFDQDERTSNLPKPIKRSLKTSSVKQLARFHDQYGVSSEAAASRLRLVPLHSDFDWLQSATLARTSGFRPIRQTVKITVQRY